MKRVVLLLVLLGWSVLAAAAERVVDFQSAIAIHADGSLGVRERITVEAEGRVIKRGIFRDFPTDYRDRTGALVRVPFEVTEVTRDGRPEPYVLQRQRNGVRVRIGSPNVFLKRGRYTYEIAYRTARQLGFFEDHDELYWNVNGNGWVFPMERVSADVRLPRAVPAGEIKVEAYTGRRGARGRDFGAEAFDGGAHFETSRPLGRYEGLTIVVMFPKGVVREPSWRERARWWLADNRGAAVGLAGLVLLLAFLYWRWRLVGRDPRAGPRFPRYEPPPGLGPAGVRYIDRMGTDDQGFAAALLGLAQRGVLFIRHHDRGDSFEIERRTGAADWLPGEAELLRKLLPDAHDSIAIAAKHDPVVQAARDGFNDALKSAFGGRYFSRNTGSFVLGLLLGIANFVLMIVLDAPILFIAAVTISMVVLLVLFSRWLPAYSVPGRKIQDAIDGLRQYLSVAEADDLARMKVPPQTAQEFARLLPYALALGVEKTWADRFSRLLGSAAVAAAVSHYYAGDVFGSGGFSASRLSSSLGDLGSTISSASTPPGSSSGGGGGGGGGGSSGGGGGGGGGGGW